MDLLGLLLASLLAEFFYWGVAYVTGCILTPIISLGKWKAGAIERNKDSQKVVSAKAGFKVSEIDNKLYLSAFGVAFLGMVFWALIIILLMVF